ncbi:LOW QUALITY PROTEIN: golgin subfamily B member 1-like [Leucoraja erinacea]|uniref:LOW QUALITY PROTEIN: golgin subfamily B member 1-like n=1 Tax=Leucoraja erinaceus TaxID=7782 RepID=UPI00245645AF|nr:LOW QUALITY PROTEIN: golgin subfamily B member 1-like [Leucoraja erinacea]
MWRWYSGNEPPLESEGALSCPQNAGKSMTDLTEQLAQNEQLVLQLKDLIREKDTQLHMRDQQLKEDKDAFEAKISKMKLQSKAKITSLSTQLEDMKNQHGDSASKEQTAGKHKQSTNGDQMANRGKILMLRKKIEELESQVDNKDSELKNKHTQLEAQLARGAEMDLMLAEKDKKLADRDAYIVELQLASVSDYATPQGIQPGEEIKDKIETQETSISDLQSMVRSLTRKVEESEERFSILQEEATGLKDQLNKEKIQYKEKEAMYIKNIHVFQEIIQAQENKLAEQIQKHEQELFLVAAKSDASADLDQLLKALKQKLHEKEEVLLGRTQVVDVLQKELDGKNRELTEVVEDFRVVQLENKNLKDKLLAEKHVMRTQVRDLMERHEADLKNVQRKHSTEFHKIKEKLQKDQQLLQPHAKVCVPPAEQETGSLDYCTERKIGELEEQVRLITQEAEKSEARFLTMKAWSKSKIRQVEEELKNAQVGPSQQELLDLKDIAADLEEENKQLHLKVNYLQLVEAQNEKLQAKLEQYEEQQQKMQADLEQVTKTSTSQTSESESAEELHSRLIKWPEMVSKPTPSHDNDERTVMELRMTQLEEEREALVSELQELEEELGDLQRRGQDQGWTKQTSDGQKLRDIIIYENEEKEHFEKSGINVDYNDATDGENLGGLRAVVNELEVERNRLQEQILVLEERCQDLEDRAQLHARVEFHQVAFGVCEEGLLLRVPQNEAEQLQNQLSRLRSQQSRDFDQHQQLVSDLKEQLNRVSNRKDYLESSLAEKEHVLEENSAKLLKLDKCKESLKAREISSQDLSEKLLNTEEKLGCITTRCSGFEVECAELKNTVLDLSEKLSSTKEKVQKQEAETAVLRHELEQTNDELERLNSSHLEDRARLIVDLQRCEREIDALNEVIVEKEHEKTALFQSMSEYSEEAKSLKEHNRCKEQETGELQAALVKVEKEGVLLKENQSADEQTMTNNLSSLVEQLSTLESELQNTKSEIEAKEKNIVVLKKQIEENNDTIHDLRSELEKQNTLNQAHLAECGPQILSLENKVATTTEKLKEINDANQKELENLKALLADSSSAKEKLDSSLKEKEEKEQILEKELKALKNHCNNLIAENTGKDEELGKLSKQLDKYKEEAVGRLQERLGIVASLEQRLQVVDESNSQLTLEVQTKETERKELKRQIEEMTKLVLDLQIQTKALTATNAHLQTTVDEQVRNISEQANLVKELKDDATNSLQFKASLECSRKDMSIENENLKSLLNDKENELIQKNNAVQQLESKIVSEIERISQHTSTISLLQKEKEALTVKLDFVEEIKLAVEQQLHEKINECNQLKDEILEHRLTTEQLQGRVQLATVRIEELQLSNNEKEIALTNKIDECTSLQNLLHKGQEAMMGLQNQVQALNAELGNKDVTLKEKLSELDGLHVTLSQHQLTTKTLESQVQELTEEGENIRQRLSDKESLLTIRSVEGHDLQGQLDQKTDRVVLLQKQMDALNIDKESLQNENKELHTSLSRWTAEHSQLQGRVNEYEHAAHHVRDQVQALDTENCRLKAELEEMKSAFQSKVGEYTSLQDRLSLKEGMITSLNQDVNGLNAATAKLTLELEEKQISLNQQANLLQQLQAKTLQCEEQLGQNMQVISGLQQQEQVLVCEAGQLKQNLQEKDKSLQQQGDELGHLQKKAAEHHALEMQNMETISKLQSQIQDLTLKTHELKHTIEERDMLLACKVEDCVNLKTVHSEMDDTVSQLRAQLAAASSEAERLKCVIKEKELSLSQIKEHAAACKEELTLKMETTETQNEAFRNKFIHLEHSFSQLNSQINQQIFEMNQLRETIAQKEASIVEQSKLVKRLEDKASEGDLLKSQFNESTELASELQRQVQCLLADSRRHEQLLQDKEAAFTHLQDRYAAQTEHFKELHQELSRKDGEMAELQTALCEKDITIETTECNTNTLMAEIESLKEELQKSCASLNDCGNTLKLKEEMFTINQKNRESQIAALTSQNLQYEEVIQQLEVVNQNLKESDMILQNKYLDQAQHIESLVLQLKTMNEKSTQEQPERMMQIENLHQQCDQLMKENSALGHHLNTVKGEKEELNATHQRQLRQKSEELQVLEEKLVRMGEVREKHDIMQPLQDENRCLQKQVSLKSEEILKLNLEVKKLEQDLMESEKKWLTELEKETEQSSLLTEKINFLGNKMESKDAQINSLQNALDNLQGKFSEQHSQLQSSSNHLKEQELMVSNLSQKLVEKQSGVDELSALVLGHENAMSELKLTLSEKEKEIENLRNSIAASENEILERAKSMADGLKSYEEEKLSLCNELSQTKLIHHSELEELQRQIADLQEKLKQSQGELGERENILDESLQQNSSVQERFGALEVELKKKSQQLEDAVNEGDKHFDALQKKEHEAQVLAMQVSQQQELVASLSQQLKQKSVSTMQLSESISKEMVKAADVEKHLTDEMQELKLRNCVSDEKISRFTCELEELKQQLEKQDSLLNAKEDQYQSIATENKQLHSQTQAVTKERDLLKKKCQAALLTRKKLMKEVKELQQSAAADADGSKQIDELRESYSKLESQVTSGQKEFKELEMHLDVFKQQLLEKDDDMNHLGETLCMKETAIEQLQQIVSQCKAEKDALSVELFQVVRDKDSSIAQLQSVLAEKEKALEDERSQLNSNLEKLKTALSKIPDHSNTGSPDMSEACDDDITEAVGKLNALKQEKEHLQKKLQAAILARKETINKAQEKDRHHKEQLAKQKEEYNHVSEKYSMQSREVEDVKEELATLRDAHHSKLTEFERKTELVGTLEKQLHSVKGLLDDKERMVEQLKVQLEEKESKMLAFVGQHETVHGMEEKLVSMVSTLSGKEAGLKSLEDTNKHLEQEKNDLISELGCLQVRIVEKSEESEKLKQSISSLEQQQDERESQAAEIHWLQNQWQSTQAEAKTLTTALEEAMKDIENYSCTLANQAGDVDCLKAQLLDLNREKDGIQAQLAVSRVENAELKAMLKQAEEAEEERMRASQLSTVQSELAKVHENLQERESTIKLLECTLSEKEKRVEELELQMQKQSIFYEAQSEKLKACTSEVQQKSADSSEEGRIKELMQRKLQAALISRKEVLKENKSLKHEINVLTSEKEELLSKIPTLERSLAEVRKQLEPLQEAALAHQEERQRLLSEADRISTEKQNLNGACESLKHTLDILTHEKQQLDSLKNSQMAELSEWKTKHDELKHEYESLLQSYENIGNEMDKMRQIVEMARKEKQEVMFKLRDGEAKRQSMERQLEEVSAENEKIKDKMRKFTKSKQQRVQELEEEIERMSSELQTITAKQSHASELSAQYNQLQEESKSLKQSYHDLKAEFDKTQKEEELLLNEFNSSISIIEELQSEDDSYQADFNEPLSFESQSLEDKPVLKEGKVRTTGQVGPLLAQKLRQLELRRTAETHEKNNIISQLEQEIKACRRETMNLNEKVKILEDDKSLLQEELEHFQEMSEKVKNEREYLEAELLKNVDKIDQLTEAWKALQMQNNSLVNELDCFREEKRHLIKEKEVQEVKLVKEFEGRLRSARRGNTSSKGETKELRELLKEKQQEIIILQKDCIKYQGLILDLERCVKTSESTCDEMSKSLESMTAKASESERQVKLVQEELASYKVLLQDTRTETEGARMQCLGLTEDLRKNEEKTKAQITQKEKELLEILDQQKTIHQKEILRYEDKLDLLERDKDGVVAETLEMQAEINGRDFMIKKLRDELNNNLAKLAAFTNSMSSLQDDRDRIIEETKKWEARFQSKENELQVKEEMLQRFQEEVKVKSVNLQELQFRTSTMKQAFIQLGSKDAEAKHLSETVNMTEVICKQSEKIEEMEGLLKDKEAALSSLSQENSYLSTQQSDVSQSVNELKMAEQTLIKNLAEKQWEGHQHQTELQADLQKLGAISQQLKLMLSSKDAEFSKLVSSKASEIYDYLVQIQQRHRKQIDDYENNLRILQQDNQRGARAMKELEVQLVTVREEKDKAVSQTGAFTKSMASLQDDRDRILSEYTELEQRHLDMHCQKDSIIQESAAENNELKQEIRNFLNQMDDLNSENALLKAQLVQYREELNQVLSLKANQSKELLQKQQQQIKNLENEKSIFKEQWEVAQGSLKQSNESLKSLREENERILEQLTELKAIGFQKEEHKYETNERQLIRELHQQLKTKTRECEELKKETTIRKADLKELENMLTEFENLAQVKAGVKMSESADGIAQEKPEEYLVGLSVIKQRLTDVINKNKEVTSRAESFEKTLLAVQTERDRYLEDIRKLQEKGAGHQDQKLRSSNDSSELTWFKNKHEELERLLQQAKQQERTEQDLSACRNELTELRSDRNLLLSEYRAMKEQYLATVADRDRQIEELRKMNHEAWRSELGNASGVQQMKPLETVSLLGIGNVAEQVKSLVAEKKQLQREAQGYLQEIHLKELQFQQLNSKATLCIEDRSTLTIRLKTVSQDLRDTQLRYEDLQHCYNSLERQHQTLRSSFQHKEQDETSENVPPGAPQERANVTVEIDKLKLNELRRRLAESEQCNESTHQELTQLADMLSDEELRRGSAEEALLAVEERIKAFYTLASSNSRNGLSCSAPSNPLMRLEPLPVRLPPREYTIQLESDEECEALLIDPSEQVVERKVKSGVLFFKRWLRGRSLYCSKLMTSRTRSRYLVLAYFVTLHVLVFMCLAGHL